MPPKALHHNCSLPGEDQRGLDRRNRKTTIPTINSVRAEVPLNRNFIHISRSTAPIVLLDHFRPATTRPDLAIISRDPLYLPVTARFY